MKAVRIPTSGPVVVMELAPAEDDDTAAFLAGLYAAIGCQSVECVELTTTWDMWLDETGMVDGRAANHRATLLAQSCGMPAQIFGDVVVTGTNDDTGQPRSLTNDQAEGILRHIGGPEAAGLDGGDIQTLTHLLNAWDPIGVADMVSDEYDCMIVPLQSRLAAGRSQVEISDFLRHELAGHFGLDPAQYDTDTVANQLIAWWARTSLGRHRMGAGGATNDFGVLDLDQVADFISARRADWTGSGLTVEPCTWLDQDAPWPRSLTTDRAAIQNPRSVGVIIRNGDLAEGQVVVYASGSADADYLRFGDDDNVVTEYVEIDSPAAIEPLLDRIASHLTNRQPPT